jgi:hypothetical protein
MNRATLYRLLKADFEAALLEEDSAWYRRWLRHGKIWGHGYFAPPMKPIPLDQLRSQRIRARALALGFRGPFV